MDDNIKKHLLHKSSDVSEALSKLNKLGYDAILFVVDGEGKLLGSLTDGDVRRGLLNGFTLDENVTNFIQDNPRFLEKEDISLEKIIDFRQKGFKIIPVINRFGLVEDIINFRFKRSYLPLDAIIMAGGKGSRLMPLTKDVPKPLLNVGEKPIIEYNIDRLSDFGVKNVYLSVNYLAEQLKEYFGDGSNKGLNIQYIEESEPLGTLGAVSKVANEIANDYVLVMNSDLLTNVDFEEFFVDFIKSKVELSLVSIPYKVNVPYAVLETDDNKIKSFQEKPSYTYYTNGGIYLLKRETLKMIPENSFYNATDLIDELIKLNKDVGSYPLLGYWLDIGKHEDYIKAQEDIKHLNF